MKLAEAARARAAGEVADARMTVGTWMAYWLENIAADRVAPSSLAGYESKFTCYIDPHLGRHRLTKLEPSHIRAMYQAMRKNGLAEATLRQTHAVLRRALKDATREGKASRNVADLLDAPGTYQKRTIPLTAAHARAVLHAAEGDPYESRWWAALYLGLRQGEALGLSWADVNLDHPLGPRLYITRSLTRVRGGGLQFKEPKTRDSTRPLPIPAPVAARLRKAWANHVAAGGDPEGLVWPHPNGNPLDPSRDSRNWHDLLTKAGVPQVELRAARTTAASLLMAAGVDVKIVSEILGHATVQLTQNVYQRGDLTQHAAAMLALEAHLDAGD